jgi:hypothetical protein
VDRSLVPSFDASRVTKIDVYAKDAPSALTIEIEKAKPKSPKIDPGRVDTLMTALRAARWHRRAAASVAGELRGKLEVIDPGRPPLVLSIGQELVGADQTWIVREDRAYLVDSWVAHALMPTELELRVRRPFAMTRVTAEMIRREGWARVSNKRTRLAVAVRPEIVAQVQAALDGLEIVGVNGKTSDPTGPMLLGVVKYGECEGGRVFIGTETTPLGCVERAAWDSVEQTIATLERPVEEIADPRPVPIVPAKVIVPDRKELVVTGRPRVDNTDADPIAVEELLAALSTPGELVPLPERAATDAFLAVGADGSEVQLQLYGNGILARRGEPIGIKTPGYAAIARTSATYRDPTRWREDPLAVSSIVVDRITYQRGAVIGEWTRTPAGKIDPAIVDALAQTLATLRAQDATGMPVRPRHKIVVTLAPPVGETAKHTLELANPGPKNCGAKLDGKSVLVPLDVCTAALAVAAQK